MLVLGCQLLLWVYRICSFLTASLKNLCLAEEAAHLNGSKSVQHQSTGVV